MGSVALTGKDTTILDTRILRDFADGDCINLDFPDNLVEGIVGKNGNVIYAYNATGQRATATLRLMLGSADDQYLNSRMREFINDSAAFVLIDAEFVKRVGDGAGNIKLITYRFNGGVVQKIPVAKENVAGDTVQAVAIYQIVFANGIRSIG